MYTIQLGFRTPLQPIPFQILTDALRFLTAAPATSPYPSCRNSLSCVEGYDSLAYPFRAVIRHHLVCDHHFLSSSGFYRRTGFGSQAGVDQSYRRLCFLRSPWGQTPTFSARLDCRLFARCTTAGRTGTGGSSGPRNDLE